MILLASLALADDGDLADFEFDDISKPTITKSIDRRADLEVFDDDDFQEDQPSLQNAFVAKEQQIRVALQRATKDKKHTKSFTQILPIMRSLSKQQKIVLAALISAQSGAPPGKEISFKQVRLYFLYRRYQMVSFYHISFIKLKDGKTSGYY